VVHERIRSCSTLTSAKTALAGMASRLRTSFCAAEISLSSREGRKTLTRPAIVTPMPKSAAIVMIRERERKGDAEDDFERGKAALAVLEIDIGPLHELI
jgi:hypothetical protein